MAKDGITSNPSPVPAEGDDEKLSQSQYQCSAQQQQQRLRFGVSFRKLDCVGIRESSQYQLNFISAAAATFRKLWARGQRQEVRILHQFDGLVRHGEMLLVLGRPGSGCSTLLKALSGSTHGFQLGQGSKINYQGISYECMNRDYPGQRTYLAELDDHFPELSVGQTLEFAATACSAIPHTDDQGSDDDPSPSPSRQMGVLFDLVSAYDTPIGNAMIRGVSGGEKRRTSIAEAYLCKAPLQCWDNSTRGLDSSTARRFVELLRESTDMLQSTVVMSLYQASEEMYSCFDKVTLLYQGRQIFFGPIEGAVEYFEGLGFERPSRATTPDFLTSLTNPAERVTRQGWESRVPRSPDEFAAAWKQSRQARSLQEEALEFDSNSTSSSEERTGGRLMRVVNKQSLHMSTSSSSLLQQLSICLRRATQRVSNSYGTIIATLVANCVLGVIVGSAFFNLGTTTQDISRRSILLFFATILNSFVPAFEVSAMWPPRPIVEKQHQYNFYQPFVERLAYTITDLPTKLILSFIIHLPIYYMANLRNTAASFMIYWCFMLMNLFTMAMFFRMMGSVSRTLEGTMTPMAILTLLCIIYAGFVVPIPYMVPWLGWFRFLNPVAYTYESLMINEMQDRQFLCSSTIPQGPAYDNIGDEWKLCPEVGTVPGTNIVDGSAYIQLKYAYQNEHLWRNFAILFSMMVAFLVFHLLAAQYIATAKPRGEVLLFSRAIKKPRLDNEAGLSPDFHSTGTTEGQPTYSSRSYDAAITNAYIPAEKTASVFHWSGITYDVKVPKGTRRILDGIDGWLAPGSLTVLMGPTGAGKTTLLDVLAGRVTSGQLQGQVLIDGHNRDTIPSFRRRMGYVQQSDFHLQTATIRETLQFCAQLRQPNTQTKKDKLQHVERILELLEMRDYAEAIVGVPGQGLNIEQRKRLSIAMEMVAKPDLVLFLDEPTSGLDSQTAWSICTLLRKLVNSGQTILCTIHQPSSQIFSMFDRLLLLREGSTIYFGDIGQDAAIVSAYFETRGARKCLAGENPANWLLEVTKTFPEVLDSSQNWAREWLTSTEREAVLSHLASIQKKSFSDSSTSPTSWHVDNHEFAVPLIEQLQLVVKRAVQDQWRNPMYLYTKTIACILLGLVNGLSFYRTDNSIQGLTNLLFSMFLLSQLFSIMSMLIAPRFIEGRNLFEACERNSKMYSWLVFIAANILVEIAWFTAISVLVFLCWYYPTGIYRNGDTLFPTAERGGLIFLFIWLFSLWASTLSQAFAAGFEHASTAMEMATLCLWLSLVFCGILVSPTALPDFWIFMYRVSPLTYVFEGLAIAGLSGARVLCSSTELLQLDLPNDKGTCGEYLGAFIQTSGGEVINPEEAGGPCQYCPISNANTVLQYVGMSSSRAIAWRNVGVVAGFVLLNTTAVFMVYYLVRLPRKKISKK